MAYTIQRKPFVALSGMQGDVIQNVYDITTSNTGPYKFTVAGGGGGNACGWNACAKGSLISATYSNLPANLRIRIILGGLGDSARFTGGGGGGLTQVFTPDDNGATINIIAGGGGGMGGDAGFESLVGYNPLATQPAGYAGKTWQGNNANGQAGGIGYNTNSQVGNSIISNNEIGSSSSISNNEIGSSSSISSSSAISLSEFGGGDGGSRGSNGYDGRGGTGGGGGSANGVINNTNGITGTGGRAMMNGVIGSVGGGINGGGSIGSYGGGGGAGWAGGAGGTGFAGGASAIAGGGAGSSMVHGATTYEIKTNSSAVDGYVLVIGAVASQVTQAAVSGAYNPNSPPPIVPPVVQAATGAIGGVPPVQGYVQKAQSGAVQASALDTAPTSPQASAQVPIQTTIPLPTTKQSESSSSMYIIIIIIILLLAGGGGGWWFYRNKMKK
jgi:hypothetical protein